MKKELGILNLELIHNTETSCYRFFYRRNSANDNLFSIVLDNVSMNRLNLNDKIFNTENELPNFLDNIINSTANVSFTDVNAVIEGIQNFLQTTDSCVEIILPVKEGKSYSQDDINKIYNTAVSALGI